MDPEGRAVPRDRVLTLYDEGISACLARDAPGAIQAVMALIGTLNFELQDAAVGLFDVYERCLRSLEAERFDFPLRVLRGLRQGWIPGEPPPSAGA